MIVVEVIEELFVYFFVDVDVFFGVVYVFVFDDGGGSFVVGFDVDGLVVYGVVVGLSVYYEVVESDDVVRVIGISIVFIVGVEVDVVVGDFVGVSRVIVGVVIGRVIIRVGVIRGGGSRGSLGGSSFRLDF